MTQFRGLLFDKDGTLFDFQATWGGWGADLLNELAEGDAVLTAAMADALGLDLVQRIFRPDSFVIAGTLDEIIAELMRFLPNWTPSGLRQRLIDSSSELQAVPAVPLAPLLEQLRSSGFVLGVATNDAEDVAVAQLSTLGALSFFDFVVGADSGHGEKPAPGQCDAFTAHTGIPASGIAMIGDSTHDLHAGRAAGMGTVAVLTGVATHADLAPHADVVLPDIGHLPGWLGI